MLSSTSSNRLIRIHKAVAGVILSCFLIVMALVTSLGQAHAFTPNYNPNNLIDNPTLLDSGSMSAGQIQTFLSNIGGGIAGYSDVEACDSTIAPYYSHCGQRISAAQIIYDAAQAYGINPRAILATMEKEQSLVTDPTPSSSQINCAMGYNSCGGYVGFFTQVDNGTWIIGYNYRGAARQAHWLSWNPGSNYPCANAQPGFYSAGLYPGNTVTFADSGGVPETVTLANAATASFYCYTPYVGPYSVTGYSGSYNFVYYYQLWFGSTQTSTPYSWAYEGQWAYSDAGRTRQLSDIPTVGPGGTIFITLKARNTGYQTWSQSNMHLGTSHPMDRASAFADGNWISNNRATGLVESSVSPGDVGTFQFEMKAPNTTGTYNEYFNPLVEGQTWLNDLGFFVQVNVTNPASPNNSNNSTLSSGQTLTKGNYLLSPDGESTLALQTNGDLALSTNFYINWETGAIPGASRLVMQGDGNLVLYNSSGTALWSSQTSGNPGARLVLQTDGNMVIYSSSNAALWATYSVSNPDHLSYVNTTFFTGRMYPGQSMDTADRRYHLIMQQDGNLVLYSPTHALWATGTDGKSVSFLAMQSDGNLVLYDKNGNPLWNSRTAGLGPMRLIVQSDGNLVLYNNANTPYWNTETQGSN